MVVAVTYKIKMEQVEENKRLVTNVMNKLNELKPEGISYVCLIAEDGQSFQHVVNITDPSQQDLIPSLPEFKEFQKDLKDRCEIPPKAVKSSVLAGYRSLQ